MIDVGLFNKALEAIELHPEEHVQESWRCETGQCLAGWIGVVSGVPWADPKDTDNSYVVNPDFGSEDDDAFEPDDRTVHVGDFAAHALGGEYIEILNSEEFDLLYPDGIRMWDRGAQEARMHSYDEVAERARVSGDDYLLRFGLFGGRNTRDQLRAALSIIDKRQAKA